MRIAQFKTSAGRGGAETMLLDLVAALTERGCTVETSYGESGWLRDQFRMRGYPTRVIHQGGFAFPGVVRAWRFLVEFRAEVVLCHGAWANLQGATAARLAGVPSLAVEHGVDPWRSTSALRNTIDRRLGRWNYRRIAVSDSVATMLVERGIIPRDRIVTIANGVMVGPPATVAARERARATLGCALSEYVIGSVGRMVPIKGHAVLLDAFKKLAMEDSAWRLVLVGDGPLRAALETEVTAAGLEDRVLFAGARDDVPTLLSAFDVFALPSNSEGLSIALLEAMAAGLPIVATAVGGNPELISDGRTGWLVAADDPEALAAALRHVRAEPLQAAQAGSAARAACIAAHLFAHTADAYYEVLEQAIVRYRDG